MTRTRFRHSEILVLTTRQIGLASEIEGLMESTGRKNRFNKLRISYIFALITVAAGAGCYGYHLYRLARDSQINKPQPQIERLVKDLRLFHSRTNCFPKNFIEVNQLIWRTTPAPNYG